MGFFPLQQKSAPEQNSELLCRGLGRKEAQRSATGAGRGVL